jgi:biopolymer transport protein ExbD
MAGGTGALQVERQKRGKASKRKKKKRIGFRLDMTPLVDITFLLLTFFMFTTTMATPQIMEMSVPPEATEIDVEAERLMTILIRGDGAIFWKLGIDEPEKIELKKIREIAIKENLNGKNKNRLITALKVADNAPYGQVINILDELNLAEISIIAQLSKEKDEEGNPIKRERRFTIAPMFDDDLKQIEEKTEGVK